MPVLLGYQSIYSSKKEKDFFKVMFCFHSENVFGQDCGTQFVSENTFSELKPDLIGKNFEFVYQFQNGRPYLTGLRFEK